MMLLDRRAALAYRIVATGLIATAVGFALGFFDGAPSLEGLKFFTTVSNVLSLVWIVVVLVHTIADLRTKGVRGWSSPSPRLAGAVMMAITVTMLIYLVVLAPQPSSSGYERFTVSDDFMHIVTPLVIIVDWLVFTPKGRLRWIDPPLWAIIPLAYLAWAFVYGATGGKFDGVHYPYSFMDWTTLGVGGVALWIVALTVALEGVGYVYVALDHALARVGRAGRTTAADAPASAAGTSESEALIG